MHAAVAWQRDANAIARRRRYLAPQRQTYAAKFYGSRRDAISQHAESRPAGCALMNKNDPPLMSAGESHAGAALESDFGPASVGNP